MNPILIVKKFLESLIRKLLKELGLEIRSQLADEKVELHRYLTSLVDHLVDRVVNEVVGSSTIDLGPKEIQLRHRMLEAEEKLFASSPELSILLPIIKEAISLRVGGGSENFAERGSVTREAIAALKSLSEADADRYYRQVATYALGSLEIVSGTPLRSLASTRLTDSVE
ncbi:MAG TPA: hypothetical protein V6D07_18940 [Trichocoleus sp.]